MKKIKLLAAVMTLTSCLLLFSVGFSSWYNVKTVYDPDKDPTGSMETYDVLALGVIENKEMQMFKYSGISFKEATYSGGALTEFKYSDTGTISVTYSVPVETLEATNGTFAVDFSLGYDALSSNATTGHKLFTTAFDEIKYSKNKYSVAVVGFDDIISGVFKEVKDSSGNTIGDSWDFNKSFTVGDLENSYEITVVYTLTIPADNESGLMNFRNSFGQYLNGSDGEKSPTKFIASAYVTDVAD